MESMGVDPESEQEIFAGSFKGFVGNGLLIIRDSDSTAVHSGWQDEDIHVEASSVYLCVQHPVDGPVVVDVFEGGPAGRPCNDITALDGSINSQFGTFILHDPIDDIRLVVRTDHPGDSRLQILVDELPRPSRVKIYFWHEF